MDVWYRSVVFWCSPLRAGLNWYAYCYNDPVQTGDSTGLSGLLDWAEKVLLFFTHGFPGKPNAGVLSAEQYEIALRKAIDQLYNASDEQWVNSVEKKADADAL